METVGGESPHCLGCRPLGACCRGLCQHLLKIWGPVSSPLIAPTQAWVTVPFCHPHPPPKHQKAHLAGPYPEAVLTSWLPTFIYADKHCPLPSRHYSLAPM